MIIKKNKLVIPFKPPYKLNIGCGHTDKEGWLNLDIADYGHNQIIWDLRDGIPLPDNSCEEILADNVLEHIGPNEDFIFVMNECLRVLQFEGLMKILVPFWSAPGAFRDPTHCRYFDPKTFYYFEGKNNWNYGIDKQWEVIESYRSEQTNGRIYATLKALKNET